ncbi:MAG: hypothetical protein HCA25_10310 [Dolichospermum sp. DET50]|nr:hypothetical protein [Dolichospermum sp. DET66]MBS3032657.1 hypothetical protein [Dolichospermum sp. DET67]MBS3037863.1 hypothetical protein [Dolichospermum sp. DET50]QSX69794.1 MAG: hypothetical protein EZY12_09530 [Dolichospermum sp. DET69]
MSKLSESGFPGLKDKQDENGDFITNYQLPITNYQWLNLVNCHYFK